MQVRPLSPGPNILSRLPMRILVKFAPESKGFTYEADDESIKVGDIVEVPIAMGGIWWKNSKAVVAALESSYKGRVAKINGKVKT